MIKPHSFEQGCYALDEVAVFEDIEDLGLGTLLAERSVLHSLLRLNLQRTVKVFEPSDELIDSSWIFGNILEESWLTHQFGSLRRIRIKERKRYKTTFASRTATIQFENCNSFLGTVLLLNLNILLHKVACGKNFVEFEQEYTAHWFVQLCLASLLPCHLVARRNCWFICFHNFDSCVKTYCVLVLLGKINNPPKRIIYNTRIPICYQEWTQVRER